MIKIKEVNVHCLEAAIRGMRNPMESHESSDSVLCKGADGFEDCTINPAGVCPRHNDFSYDVFCIGKNDYELALKLCKAGSDHRKFMRMIIVSMDVTAPLYWWKEYDTYKVGTVANSTSTMHKIHSKAFSRQDFSCDRMSEGALACLDSVIRVLEDARLKFVETKKKHYWDDMIQLLPSSYNQKRTIVLSYEVLCNMYHARKAHKLDEWRDFCKWVEELPYSELITEQEGNSCD